MASRTSTRSPQHDTTPVESEPERLPVPTRQLPSFSRPLDTPPTDWPTNLDLSTPQGKAALLNAANPANWQPSDGGTYRILATHWIVYPDEVTNPETGEISVVSTTVFIDREGHHVKLRSDFAPRRLHAMIGLYTPAEWATGILIECYAAPSRYKGRTYGSFRVIPSPLPEAGDGGTGHETV